MQSQTLISNNEKNPLSYQRGDALHLSLLRTFIRSTKFKTPKSRKMIGRFFYPSANIKDEADASCTTSLSM